MTHYLLSVHSVEGAAREPMTDEEMQRSHQRLRALEQDLKSTGAWVFSGRLHEPATSTVVRMSGGEVVTTDGPFVESREHLGGFYIIQAEDLDAALAWASRVTGAINVPIEVRPFAGFEA
jgi:hypothetical protein